MAKIFYVRERSGDYAQINFFKTEKEALNYGISEWPDFDMFGDEEDEDELELMSYYGDLVFTLVAAGYTLYNPHSK